MTESLGKERRTTKIKKFYVFGSLKIYLHILLLGFSVLSFVLFFLKDYLPFYVSIVLMSLTIALFFSIKRFYLAKFGLIALALPYIHLLPYLWFDWNERPELMWGLASNPYMFERDIINLTSMIAAISVIAFYFGVLIVQNMNFYKNKNADFDSHPPRNHQPALPIFYTLILCLFSIFSSYLVAPKETILTAAYTTSEGISQGWDFSSLWTFSYVALIFAFVDAIFEYKRFRKKIKFFILIISTLIIVTFFQLLRGDRESITLVISLIFIYFFLNPFLIKKNRKTMNIFKLAKVGLLVFVIIFVSYFFGAARSSMSYDRMGFIKNYINEFQPEKLFYGTWSAVLLTPLSVAGDYIYGLLKFEYGQTYIDLILSLPPGFIANFLGYERPIDAFKGPAWKMTYGIGGTHATVVPFMNFGLIGVFFILILIGYFLAYIDLSYQKKQNATSISLAGVLVMILPHWFWYGEKYFINVMIIWFLFYFLYEIFCGIKREKSPNSL